MRIFNRLSSFTKLFSRINQQNGFEELVDDKSTLEVEDTKDSYAENFNEAMSNFINKAFNKNIQINFTRMNYGKIYESINKSFDKYYKANKNKFENIDTKNMGNFVEEMYDSIGTSNVINGIRNDCDYSSRVIKMIYKLLIEWKLGNREFIFIEIKTFFATKPEELCDTFYDDVITAISYKTEIEHKKVFINFFFDEIKMFALKKLLVSLINECFSKYQHLDLFISYPDLLNYNMIRRNWGNKRPYKSIFHDIIYDYINKRTRKYTNRDEFVIGNFIYKLYMVFEPYARELMFEYDVIETYLEHKDNYFLSWGNKALIDLIIKINTSEREVNSTTPYNFFNASKIPIEPMIYKKTKEDLADDIKNIISNYRSLLKRSIFKHFDKNQKIRDVAIFLGFVYDNAKGVCPLSQCMMVKPFSFGDMVVNSEKYDIVYYWLKSLRTETKTKPTWTFNHFMTNEIVDINNYKVNRKLKKDVDTFIKRVGNFKYFLPNYEGIQFEEEHEKDNFDDYVRFVANKAFNGDELNDILLKYEELPNDLKNRNERFEMIFENKQKERDFKNFTS